MKAAPTVLCEQAKVTLLLSRLLMDLLGPLLAMRTVVLATLSESVAVQILVVQSANDLCGVLQIADARLFVELGVNRNLERARLYHMVVASGRILSCRGIQLDPLV